MKKVKFYALALVLVLGLIGAAYANGWTDELIIAATAETGEMNVRFRQTGTEVFDGTYDSISIVERTDKKLTLELKDLYPREAPWDGNAYVTLEVNILNDGTVPAQLTGLEVERVLGSGPQALYEKLMMSIYNSVDDPFPVSAIGNVPIVDIVLEPGEDTDGAGYSGDFLWYIWLSEDAGDDLQNESVQVEVTFKFEQANL